MLDLKKNKKKKIQKTSFRFKKRKEISTNGQWSEDPLKKKKHLKTPTYLKKTPNIFLSLFFLRIDLKEW